MDNTIKFCRKSGYVNNIFGRRSHITGINDKNFNIRNFQERAAINAPIQGSAAEIMRLAMIRINKKMNENNEKKCKMLLQIHDELIFEVPKEREKKFRIRMSNIGRPICQLQMEKLHQDSDFEEMSYNSKLRNMFGDIIEIIVYAMMKSANVNIESYQKKVKYKVLSITIGVFAYLISYATLLEILSRPKPKNLELLNKYANELTLLHVNWVEGEAIYLLVQLDNLIEPRLYEFPWNAAQAQEYDEMLEEGRENGEEVKIANPFFPTNAEERKTIIYTAPAKPLPPKEAPETGITSYDPNVEEKLLDYRDKREN